MSDKKRYNVERLLNEQDINQGGLFIISNTLDKIVAEVRKAAGKDAVIITNCSIKSVGTSRMLLLKAETIA